MLYWSIAKLPRNQKQDSLPPRWSRWCFRDRPDKRRQIPVVLGQIQNLNQTCTGITKRAVYFGDLSVTAKETSSFQAAFHTGGNCEFSRLLSPRSLREEKSKRDPDTYHLASTFFIQTYMFVPCIYCVVLTAGNPSGNQRQCFSIVACHVRGHEESLVHVTPRRGTGGGSAKGPGGVCMGQGPGKC